MHRAIANALKHPLRSVRKTAKFSASKRPQRLESNRCHLRRFSSTMSKDPFVVLQLQRPTQNSPISEDDVKAAFRKAAIRTHPDQGGTAAAFREATDAYEECLRVVLSRYGRQSSTPHERTAASHGGSDHIKWAHAMDLLIKSKDFKRAWNLWHSRLHEAAPESLGLSVVDVGLKLCAAGELRDALALLAEIEGRSLFMDNDQRVACYNSLLWHCHRKGSQGDMDLILEILRVMDRKGLQPDLALLDLEIFTFFPRSS